MNKKKWIPIAAAAVVLSTGSALATIVLPDSGQPDGAPEQFSPSRGHVTLIADSQSGILAELTRRLPAVSNPALVEETIPAEDGSPSVGRGLVLTYELAVNSASAADSFMAQWEGELFTGAVADELAGRQDGPLTGARATFVFPDGERQLVGGGVGHVVRDQVFAPIPADATARVRDTESRFGLSGAQVRLVHGLQDAIAIRASTTTPTRTVSDLLHSRPVETMLGVPRGTLEGTFLEVDDAAGKPVFMSASAPRNGAGMVWVDPSLGLSVTR